MTLVLTDRRRQSYWPLVLICLSQFVLLAALASGSHVRLAAGFVVLCAASAFVANVVVPWPQLIGGLILVILFIPIRRYTLPGNLPFELEPYRVVVGLLVLGWIASILVDQRMKLRATGFEAPLVLIVASLIASVAVNPGHVAASSTEVAKSLTFFLSFVLLLYLIASTVRRLEEVEQLVKVLVVGGGIVALFAILEARTGINVFNHLSRVLPFLYDLGDVGGFQRVGTTKFRVFASAQHPIALSAAFVILIPLAVYLARRYRQRRWLVCAVLFAAACFSTVSRTGILMLAVVAVVFLWLRSHEMRRLWPALLPGLVAIHFMLPGTLGAIKHSFNPAGGLIGEQSQAEGSGSGRLADLGPALHVWTQEPLLGQGFGTVLIVRNDVQEGPQTNILDDQWLGTLLATGVLGFAGWMWLFASVIRRFGRAAKLDRSERGWLLTCLTAGIAAYGVGMLTYDAFSFIQVTFLFFILLGLGSVLLGQKSPAPAEGYPNG
jgi:hypothetical protein